MNYELAKELKEAGFPQEGYWWWLLAPEALSKEGGGVEMSEPKWSLVNVETKSWRSEYEAVYAPSLSELIDACGEKFICVRNWYREQERFGNKPDFTEMPWIAESNKVEGSDEGTNSYISAQGSTPEEAVARLWLELNKKEA